MNNMKILVIGGGGREHALVWKISQSHLVKKIFCAPGNAGTAELAKNIEIDAENISALLEFALKEKVDLTVVGPETPLVLGIVDKFQEKGLKIFGPSKSASMLEGSKAYSKELLNSLQIPSAKSIGDGVFSDRDKAIKAAAEKEKMVVKVDGLAAGKGVFVSGSVVETIDDINTIMKERAFGSAGDKIILEELLVGEEASILAFCDGENVKLMVSSQDHKPIFDNDLGKNTGGMGAYSPAPVITEKMLTEIEKNVVKPVVLEMKKRGTPYVGVLYIGLMIIDKKPFVLEFNVRFGDPEAQVILPRLKSDLVEIMLSCVDKKLFEQKIEWIKKAATCVVLAAGGYPQNYEKGKKINGLKEVANLKDTVVFHAGTKQEKDFVVTSGGRVLGVTSLGNSIKESIENSYNAVSKISFEKMYFRTDIGKKALKRL